MSASQANSSPVYPHLLAPFIFVVYDYFLTLGDEVEYVWARKQLLSAPTIIYLVLRYFGIGFLFFAMIRTCLPTPAQWDPLLIGYTQEPTLCLVDAVVSNTGFIVQLWLSDVTFWLAQVILQMRLYFLHGCSKTVLLVMGWGFIIEVIVMMGVMAYTSVAIRNAEQIMDILPQILFLKYSILGFYDFLLFCLAILNGIRRSREEIQARPANRRGMPLVKALIEGNIVYFFVNSLAVSVGIMLYASTGLQSILLLGDQMTMAVAAVAGCRLILRIRCSESPTSDTSDTDVGSWEARLGEMSA